MSKIKIYGLGGLSESGKNSYVVEVDKDIYIFDCGLKYANENLYGIDYIIPDFSYLIKNKNRIVGVFLTHAHQENMGATYDLVKLIPTLKVYATKFTKFMLLQDGVNANNIIEIEAHKKIDFNGNSIFPISVSHSVPDSVMYVLNTKDGSIVYTGDFIIDPKMMGAYDMDLGKIAYIGKQKVLALLCESSFSERQGHTSPNHRLTSFFKYTINHAPKRIIFTVLQDHLYTLQEIFNGALNTHKKIVLYGKDLENMVNFAISNNYLSVQNGLIGSINDIDKEDSIVIMTDDRANPYSNLSKMLNGYDKFVHLKPSDTIVFAEPRYDATEKLLVKLENDLARVGCNIISMPKDKIILHHASQEDLMLMIKLINPKYYIPVKGEYRYMVNNASLAIELGTPKDNVILKQNGEVINIIDGNYKNTTEKIKVNDILIDGKSSSDVGDLVIKDREMLSENGIVLISATLSKKTHKLIVGPEVTTRGFIYQKDSKEMIDEIKRISEEVIMRNVSNKYTDYNQIKQDIREELGNYLYDQTECKPMIIAVVQEV